MERRREWTKEDGNFTIFGSAQSKSEMHKAIAKVLKLLVLNPKCSLSITGYKMQMQPPHLIRPSNIGVT